MPGMELRQTGRLVQMPGIILSPALRQSLELLQIPSVDLDKLIETELVENPLLEVKQDDASPDQGEEETPPEAAEGPRADGETTESGEEAGPEQSEEEPRRADADEDHMEFLDGLEDTGYEGSGWNPEEPWRPEIVEKETLSEHLLKQISDLRLPADQEEACRFVVYSLDGHGLLSMGIAELEAGWGGPPGLLEGAVSTVRKLEPAGVGFCTVPEALDYQLSLRGYGVSSLERRMVSCCFEAILGRQYPAIAKNLGVTPREVQDAVEIIKTFNPYPGSDFAPDTNSVIIPDVTIEKIDGNFVTTVNDSRFPMLIISERNRRALESRSTLPEEREYVRDKLARASLFLRSIMQRQQTVGRIAEYIADYQRGFLDSGVDSLRPLTLQQAAEHLKCNQSTISRAINGKYVQTPQGVFEMRYFFNRGLPQGEEISTRTVKEELRKIIEREDPARPYSDEDLARILTTRGFVVKRRTVANYRGSMDIPAKTHRKRYR